MRVTAPACLFLLALACGGGVGDRAVEEACPPPPCPIPTIRLVVTDAVSGDAVAGVTVSGVDATCTEGTAATECVVVNPAPGGYALDVSAPGHLTSRVSVTVEAPTCGGCPAPAYVQVALQPAT